VNARGEEVFNGLHGFVFKIAPFGAVKGWQHSTSLLELPKDGLWEVAGPQLASIAGNSQQRRCPPWRASGMAAGSRPGAPGSARVDVLVRETVRCVMYDKKDVRDVVSVRGEVFARVEGDGMIPDVALVLAGASLLSNIVLSHCAQAPDEWKRGAPTVKLCFTPPAAWTRIARYNVDPPPKPPLRAYFQLKEAGDRVIKALVQLKMAEGTPAIWEHLEVVVPFPNRGSIAKVDATPSVGQVASAPSGRALVWTIGQKLPKNVTEMTLKMTVEFVPRGSPAAAAAAGTAAGGGSGAPSTPAVATTPQKLSFGTPQRQSLLPSTPTGGTPGRMSLQPTTSPDRFLPPTTPSSSTTPSGGGGSSSLAAISSYGHAPSSSSSSSSNDPVLDDPFLVGQTGYIIVNFRIQNHLPSGVEVDRHIVLHPQPAKLSVNVARETVTADQRPPNTPSYTVWNSLGEARVFAEARQ
jgi:hypothetical protein